MWAMPLGHHHLFYNTRVQDCRAGTASPRSSAELVPSQVHLMASGKGREREDTADRQISHLSLTSDPHGKTDASIMLFLLCLAMNPEFVSISCILN